MKRFIVVLITVIMVSHTPAQACDCVVTDQQLIKQNVFHALTVADAVTTMVGVSRGFVETNGVLGASPDPGSVIVFFIARNTLHHLATTHIIPDQWRDAWLNTWIGAQSIVVLRNIHLLK